MEWISVKDKLPETKGEYLVWVTGVAFPYCKVGFFNTKWTFELFPDESRITHWMQLPLPPK